MSLRHRSRRSAVTAVLLMVIPALALAGCSLGGGDPSTPVPSRPQASTTVPVANDPASQTQFAHFYHQKPAWTSCGNGFECTKVTVPVDWAQPSGDTFPLALIRTRATGSRLGSLFMNPGGPGVSGVDFLREVMNPANMPLFGSSLTKSFDLVSWDPRGTGASSPILCLPNSELDAYNALDSSPDTPAEQDILLQANKHFDDGCSQHTGGILAHVDTLSTVKDMDVMRAVVGDATLTYYGASYGTFLGAWYAQTFPWRVGRLTLDGAVDPSSTAGQYIQGQALGFNRGLDAYLHNCLSVRRCPFRGTFDQAKTQLTTLIAGADQTPLKTDSGRQLTQALMTTGIIQGMYTIRLWPDLNKALTKALQGDGTGLLVLADQYNERDSNGTYKQTMQATGPIYCLDHQETRTVAQIATDAQALDRQYPPLGGVIGWSSLGCAGWPIKPVVKPQRLTAAGATPILVVGSTGDPATPYEWAQNLAGQLSSGRLLTRVGFGHTAYAAGSACIDTAIETYLVSGVLPANGTRCNDSRTFD